MIYEEDYLHPNNQDTNETKSQASDDVYTVSSYKRKEKKEKDKYLREKLVYDEFRKRMTKLVYFDSGVSPMRYIRDAITGEKYNVKVGSFREDSFFKVRIAMGENENPATLFYQSPEEHERHFQCSMDPLMKQQWLEKSKYCEILEKEFEESKPRVTIVK
jgi:hypothetical protein